MHISTVFNNMHTASQGLYKAAVNYGKAKKALAERFSQNFDVSGKDQKAIKNQIDIFRNTTSGKYYESEREKVEIQRRAAFNKASQDFKAASENLPEAVTAFQPDFDVNNDALQNSLNIAKIGKDLPETAARNLLLPLRTNKSNFEIVKSALQRAGVNPDYIKGVFPFDGESMQFDYDLIVDDIMERSSVLGAYTFLAELEARLIDDGAAFGVNLSQFVEEEYKEAAADDNIRRAMNLQSFSDVDMLEYL